MHGNGFMVSLIILKLVIFFKLKYEKLLLALKWLWTSILRSLRLKVTRLLLFLYCYLRATSCTPLATFIINCFDFCTLIHVHHEMNTCADLLAKDSISCSSGTAVFRHPPYHIFAYVLYEIASFERARSFSLSFSCSRSPCFDPFWVPLW